MEEAVLGARYENMQYLISEAKWNEDAVGDQIARQVNGLIGDSHDACLIIDESSFGKKGECSVGVARQWNGRLGKVENSQVGVFASLAKGNQVCPVGARLYLPKEWTDDSERLKRAKVPEAYWRFRTKHTIALELVDRARKNGLEYGWIGADSFYGHCPSFLWELVRRGETFVLDLHSNDHVYLSAPNPYQPPKKGSDSRGRKPAWRSKAQSYPVNSLAAATPDGQWSLVKARDTTVGELWLEAMSVPVWLFDKATGAVRAFTLLVTRDPQTKREVKYSVSNASPDTSLQRLVHMNRQRFWIERALEDGKGNAGMADYQVRGWLGWHRHMVLVMMALLFMLQLKVEHKDDIELLSCADIKEVLALCLPDRRITPGEIARQLRIRHEKRRRRTEACYAQQGRGKPDRDIPT